MSDPTHRTVVLRTESGELIKPEVGEYRVLSHRLIVTSTRSPNLRNRSIDWLTEEFIVVREET